MTAYNLFLDDFRIPKDAFGYTHLPIYLKEEWVIVRNYYAFIALIEGKGIPNCCSFDHDLADCHYENPIPDYNDETLEKTGYHCANWLINYCIDNKKELPAKIFIHTLNPAGRQNIESLFKSYLKSLSLPSSTT